MYYVAVPMQSKQITLYRWMPADIINDAIRSHPKRVLCLNFSIKKLQRIRTSLIPIQTSRNLVQLHFHFPLIATNQDNLQDLCLTFQKRLNSNGQPGFLASFWHCLFLAAPIFLTDFFWHFPGHVLVIWAAVKVSSNTIHIFLFSWFVCCDCHQCPDRLSFAFLHAKDRKVLEI